mmetsp:Transcript_29328/g.94566  ORF Transcript_29328/g.94566 Transcript_29328/m.94566 type:complete len:171 (+) Transcript_29328:42-554(+)|eukprot:scaffold23723_cov124-Isochrysis_galbana.AAC.3
MLAFSVLQLALVLVPTTRVLVPATTRAPPVMAGFFDMFKETDAQKAAKEASFREQQEILRRRRNPSAMEEYEDDVRQRRAEILARDAELRAVQEGRLEGDALEQWKALRAQGKVLTSETAVRDPDSARLGSEGLVAQRMDEQLPYIDQGYTDDSQPDLMAEIGKMFKKKE